ncbi:MAG: hypothetical protein EZS28_024912 [Streblomastix strix]|uniref:Uncharacterized protein n=1 Tax=Streblomastix strix TaxID=222440 RepID=A0A5J4VAQ0_9EUKA|nr:MAG: hypothetical protein EZS28_024912 [Streblomastix strix]
MLFIIVAIIASKQVITLKLQILGIWPDIKCEYSTNALWNDLIHLSLSTSAKTEQLEKAVALTTAINQLLLYGSNSQYSNQLTGDQLIDGLFCTRTLSKGSLEEEIQFSPRDIFINRPGESKDINSTVDLRTPAVQIAASLLMFDLQGGCSEYRLAIIDEQQQAEKKMNSLLILFFILAIIATLTGYLLCLIPTRSIIFKIAQGTEKMKDINPASDVNERTGMGAASWKEEYSCDCQRLDKAHQKVLMALAGLCYSLDGEINIQHQINLIEITLQQHQSIDGIQILNNVNEVIRMREEARNNNYCTNGDQKQVIDITLSFDEAKLKQLSVIIRKLLEILIRVTFSSLSDEEDLITKYHIPHHHKKDHHAQHAVFLRKIQQEILIIARATKQHSKQLYSGWLVNHVSKVDRELTTLLVGKAPESELESQDLFYYQLSIPQSYSHFLESDSASIQDKNLFNKMLNILELKVDQQNT